MNTFTPQEIQFLTESEPIEILPRYTMASIDLITINVPKLVAMQRCEVPIWLATLLKQQQKCSIIPPQWLNMTNLKHFYSLETTQLNSFSDLPPNWLEIAKLFFEFASDDLDEEVHKFKQIVQDLKEIRMIKVRKGVTQLNESNLQLDNLSTLEINEIRPFLVKTMERLAALDNAAKGGDELA